MAEVLWNEWSYLYAAIVLLSAATLAFLLVRVLRRPAPAPAAPATAAAEGSLAAALAGGASPEPYMAQFVLDAKGERVGETISVTPERVVVKKGETFYALPASVVQVAGGNLVADATVDWEAAAREGETWRAAGHRAITYDASGMPVEDKKE